MVGIIYLPRRTDGDVEVAYSVAPEFRRRGYATSALKLAVRWLFDERPDLRYMEVRTSPTNLATRRVAEKADFSYVRTEEGLTAAATGERYDEAVYSLAWGAASRWS